MTGGKFGLLLGTLVLCSCDNAAASGGFSPNPDGDPSADGSILGYVGASFNVSRAFRLLEKPNVRSLSIHPSDLATKVSIDADVGFVCQREGTGTLWVYYSSNDDPFLEYYNLECRSHEQRAGG